PDGGGRRPRPGASRARDPDAAREGARREALLRPETEFFPRDADPTQRVVHRQGRAALRARRRAVSEPARARGPRDRGTHADARAPDAPRDLPLARPGARDAPPLRGLAGGGRVSAGALARRLRPA